MELFISCVDVENKEMIHPYVVTGTGGGICDKHKNESNGELFKIKIRENVDVDLKIAIMAIVEKDHQKVLRLIQDSHNRNGIMLRGETFQPKREQSQITTYRVNRIKFSDFKLRYHKKISISDPM